MTPEERRQHNDSILSKLDFAATLAEFKRSEWNENKGRMFIDLACLLLYLRRTEKRQWSRDWIEQEIGVPDRVEEWDGQTELLYRLHFEYPDVDREVWAALGLKDGYFVQLATC